MFCRVVVLAAALASLWANSLPAQDAILGQKYGQGVHAYFAGDYQQAFEQLTSAIAGGSKDPRAFYFRGLTYLQYGQSQEAQQDFQKGADLESRDINKFYNVSKALERVQGSSRVALESYRVEARMAVAQQLERLRKARYEAIQREESRVLRQQSLAPPEPVATPEPTAEPTSEPAGNPFAAPEENAGPKPGKKAANDTSGQQPGNDAADEKKPAETPAGADPFAVPEEKPASKPAQKPPAGKKTGVFGALGKALGKAVAGEGERPAAKEKPPAKKEQ